MNNILVELSSSMAAAVENASASTVMVNARQRLPGSGMVFAPGLVLTGNHVVSPDENILILFSDGKEIAVNFAGRNHGSDLAVLRFDKYENDGANPAEIGGQPRIGRMVIALSGLSSNGIEASLGIVSTKGGPVLTPLGSLDGYIRSEPLIIPVSQANASLTPRETFWG